MLACEQTILLIRTVNLLASCTRVTHLYIHLSLPDDTILRHLQRIAESLGSCATKRAHIQVGAQLPGLLATREPRGCMLGVSCANKHKLQRRGSPRGMPSKTRSDNLPRCARSWS